MTSNKIIGESNAAGDQGRAKAAANLAYLFRKLARLYTGDEASSLSQFEATQIARSLEYALGLRGGDAKGALHELVAENPDELFARKQHELDSRVEKALATWAEIVATMPRIDNVALRDTLASIGQLKSRYDTYFAAHEVPCDIDYQLHRVIDPALVGIDYIEAYLAQLLEEARWLAQFDTERCVRMLENTCPDFRGLHVNLVDLLVGHEAELGAARSD